LVSYGIYTVDQYLPSSLPLGLPAEAVGLAGEPADMLAEERSRMHPLPTEAFAAARAIRRDTSAVLMGGWMRPPTEGLPAWGPEMDWNVPTPG